MSDTTKPVTNRRTPFAKIRNRLDKAGSGVAFACDMVEEAYVRMWSHESIRAMVRPFLPVRTPDRWVFIVGCYNSGTTLVQKILGAHPELAGLPREGVRFTNVLSNLEANNHHMMWDEGFREVCLPKMEDDSAYRRICADWSIFWKRNSSVFVEKSVSNSARIDWLERVFPNAAFVGIHRNGYCVTEGLLRRAQPPTGFGDANGRYPISMAAQQWVTANELLLEQLPRCEHSLMVPFEKLVESPETVLQDLLELAGVSTSPLSVLNGQIRIGDRTFQLKDPNPSSLARLNVEECRKIDPIISHTMARLGYDSEFTRESSLGSTIE